jgi:hypothetical protein
MSTRISLCDSVTGSWMNRDPGGFAMGDANLYRYVGNEPTDGTDPSGLVKDVGLPPNAQPGNYYLYSPTPPPGGFTALPRGFRPANFVGTRVALPNGTTIYYPDGYGPGIIGRDWQIQQIGPVTPPKPSPPPPDSIGAYKPKDRVIQNPGGGTTTLVPPDPGQAKGPKVQAVFIPGQGWVWQTVPPKVSTGNAQPPALTRIIPIGGGWMAIIRPGPTAIDKPVYSPPGAWK